MTRKLEIVFNYDEKDTGKLINALQLLGGSLVDEDGIIRNWCRKMGITLNNLQMKTDKSNGQFVPVHIEATII